MKPIIKVHYAETGKEVIVNMRFVDYIHPENEDSDRATIEFNSGGKVPVEETCREIYDLIYNN